MLSNPVARSAALASLLLVKSVAGQLSAPGCQPGWEWSFNTLGQNACTVAAYLEATCNSGQFSIAPLTPGHQYTGPSGPDNGDICKCNTVAYNLISACDACQGSAWIQWSEWSFNCTAVAHPGTFPNNIPPGTRVPRWAYLDTTTNDTWNNFTAFAAGDAPESTATAAPTTVGRPGNTGSPTDRHSSSHAGAIAGGVVGGVVGLALIAGAVAWFLIRRRRAKAAPSAQYLDEHQTDMSQTYGSPTPFTDTSTTPRKYYDPSDPTTFPSSAPSPTIHTTNTSTNYQNSFSELQPNRQQYNGLPEV